jgi:hypothetical protein
VKVHKPSFPLLCKDGCPPTREPSLHLFWYHKNVKGLSLRWYVLRCIRCKGCHGDEGHQTVLGFEHNLVHFVLRSETSGVLSTVAKTQETAEAVGCRGWYVLSQGGLCTVTSNLDCIVSLMAHLRHLTLVCYVCVSVFWCMYRLSRIFGLWQQGLWTFPGHLDRLIGDMWHGNDS